MSDKTRLFRQLIEAEGAWLFRPTMWRASHVLDESTR
jgi:hypothetical protein